MKHAPAVAPPSLVKPLLYLEGCQPSIWGCPSREWPLNGRSYAGARVEYSHSQRGNRPDMKHAPTVAPPSLVKPLLYLEGCQPSIWGCPGRGWPPNGRRYACARVWQSHSQRGNRPNTKDAPTVASPSLVKPLLYLEGCKPSIWGCPGRGGPPNSR